MRICGEKTHFCATLRQAWPKLGAIFCGKSPVVSLQALMVFNMARRITADTRKLKSAGCTRRCCTWDGVPSCGNKMLGDDSVVESPSIYVRTCPCEGGTQAISLMKGLPSSRCLLCSLLLCTGLLACSVTCVTASKYHVIISITASNYLCVISVVQKADLKAAADMTQKVLHAKRKQAYKPFVQHFYSFFSPSLILQVPCQMSKWRFFLWTNPAGCLQEHPACRSWDFIRGWIGCSQAVGHGLS